MTKISIIIPYYNNTWEEISGCLNSIIKQNIKDLEIIIVNDGSRDEFAKILDKAQTLSQNIRIISQKNGGPSSARNHGIRYAKGEYVTFLDADDYLIDGSLGKMLKEIETGAELIIGGISRQESDKHNSETSYERKILKNEEEKQLLKCMLISLRPENEFHDGYIGRGPVARIVRREIALKNQFDENIVIGEDILWNLGLVNNCSEILICYDSWYFYRCNENSLTQKYDKNIIKKLDIQLKALIEFVDVKDDKQLKAFADHVMENIYIVWNNCLSMNNEHAGKIKKADVRQIYKGYPWTVAGKWRYFRIADWHRKILCILYNLKLIFLFYRIRR